jgi:hypothetical protein
MIGTLRLSTETSPQLIGAFITDVTGLFTVATSALVLQLTDTDGNVAFPPADDKNVTLRSVSVCGDGLIHSGVCVRVCVCVCVCVCVWDR